jgi:hypothetical protein
MFRLSAKIKKSPGQIPNEASYKEHRSIGDVQVVKFEEGEEDRRRITVCWREAENPKIAFSCIFGVSERYRQRDAGPIKFRFLCWL